MAEKKELDKTPYIWAATRIGIGLIFLWAFFDKLLGLGFSTCRAETGAITTLCESAWLSGGSPTYGFLAFGTSGPLAGFFQGLAGLAIVDWLFMLGLLGIGVALTFGIAMRLGTYSGAILLMLMWAAVLPLEHHPLLDDHVIYALVLLGLNKAQAGNYWGLGSWWSEVSFVKKIKCLQ